MTSEIEHPEGCRCWRCLSHQLGCWVDQLGAATAPGEWQVFATITYRTKEYPWQRGFPRDGTGRPKADFAHHLFDRLVSHLEHELSSRLDYVVADQLGSIHGRFHQHAILAADGLRDYPRKQIWEWLQERAGWSRVLPFEKGAAYYISRYVGRDINRCDWTLRIGEPSPRANHLKRGTDIVISSMLPKNFFHNNLIGRKR